MEIESVRALKREIIARVLRPLLLRSFELEQKRRAAEPRRLPLREVAPIALGIAPGGLLAVRVQQRNAATARLVEEMRSMAHEEVEVRYVGSIRSFARAGGAAWLRARRRPLVIGASIGHFAVTAGTLGAFATERKTGATVILGNNHVLADEDRGRIGDAVLQPGAADGGSRANDRVGALLHFVALNRESTNIVDAAVATIDADVAFDATTLTGFGKVNGAREEPLLPGTPVAKLGRTTGLTRGIVTAIEVDDVRVDYDSGRLVFDDQIEIEGTDGVFSRGGDSGSLIVDERGHGCGLLFAGSTTGGSNGRGLTYANPIDRVLGALGLALPALGTRLRFSAWRPSSSASGGPRTSCAKACATTRVASASASRASATSSPSRSTGAKAPANRA
ncbi:hypothetical protein QNA08_14605 [Chelatococcus sp. SYSU_G07232]|uniref:Serine protease n=1 Tax=Chelatococcus albus TaxID=3047466 RepID=A0ABT7AJA9_9HYPH|nr:hypothetical protein [Chelatococcus sp. SYSU_G07232]MDJ1159466.1 hypothetical protein [Chelatococcus sp. SYSU_G07232]